MAPPTLIFVPGSWHIPATWSKVTALLPQYKCICVELPSTTSDTTKGLTADITAVRTVIAAETSAGNNVIVVVHSYGGAVGSSAIQGFTQPKEGSAEAGNGVVLGMVFIVTWFHPTGMSFMDALGGKAPEPPLWTMDTEKGLVVLAGMSLNLTVVPHTACYHTTDVLPQLIPESSFTTTFLSKKAMTALRSCASNRSSLIRREARSRTLGG
jgi:pimeloyl-ACP methyl ester carboxylesterase